MPRKGKGGKAEGSPQTAYSNRSDLNNRGPQPITAAPGEPYGQRKMLEDAQKAVPMSGTPSPPASAMPQSAPPAPAPAQPGTLGFYDPAPHPPMPVQPNTIKDAAPQAGQRIADLLETAASSAYATPAVQELAALARQIGV